MTDTEFASWRAQSLPGYADEKVRSGAWTAAEAPARAEQELAQLLPAGLRTEGHHLFTIQDAAGHGVGALWVARSDRGGQPVGYIYDLVVWPQHQRQGHAERAMRALEDQARALGFTGLALHVFGHNHGAHRLYVKLGYAPTNINMFKAVAGAGEG